MSVINRKKRITWVLVALAAFAWMTHSTYRHLLQQKIDQREPRPPLIAGMPMATDLFLESIDGKQVPLSDYKGKVILLNFWASWCAPCMHEMPGLFALQKEFRAKGLVVLGLNMDDNPALGLAVLRKVAGQADFPIFKGVNAPIAERFSIEGLPFTVLVDKNFKIIFAKPGEVDWISAGAKELVGSLL